MTLQASSTCFFLGIFAVVATPTLGQEAVRFDARKSYPCHPVKQDAQAIKSDGKQLVEAVIKISASTGERDHAFDSLIYQIRLPDDSDIELVDFFPKKIEAVEIAKIEIKTLQNSVAERRSLQIRLAGRRGSYGISAQVDAHERHSSAAAVSEAKLELIPPVISLLSAATIDRGTGVEFKLQPSTQHTLAGEREFPCLLLVPKDWKGGIAKIACFGRSKGDTRDVTQVFDVALYIDGDDASRKKVLEQIAAADVKKAGSPKAAAPPGVFVATFQDCVGTWRWRTTDREIVFRLRRDGSFTAQNHPFNAEIADWVAGDGKGHWDVRDGRLCVTMTHVELFLWWEPHVEKWIDKVRIVKVGKSEIELEDGGLLRRVH